MSRATEKSRKNKPSTTRSRKASASSKADDQATPPAVAEPPAPMSPEELEALDFSGLAPARSPGDARLEAEGIEHEVGFWTTVDGIQLYWQAWSSEATPRRGCVALMHGYGEHCSRYHHVAVALVRAGYNVMAIDARGHGRSTGIRAHVDRYADYVRDMALLKRNIEGRWPHLPLFVLGHSNGGLITLRYALTRPTRVRGFIVTSPLVGIKVAVSPAKAAAGKLMSRVWPHFSLPSGLDARDVCQNPDVIRHYASDPLNNAVATARYFTEVNEATASLFTRAHEIDQPFLFLIAGNDAVVDAAATERLFHRLGSHDRELEVYPDLFHEILNEEVWPDIVRRIVGWMEAHRLD